MPYETKTLQQMTTIEEIENEIAALKEALEIIEERTGDKLDNSMLLDILKNQIRRLTFKLEDLQMDLPVHPYEPEFEKD